MPKVQSTYLYSSNVSYVAKSEEQKTVLSYLHIIWGFRLPNITLLTLIAKL